MRSYRLQIINDDFSTFELNGDLPPTTDVVIDDFGNPYVRRATPCENIGERLADTIAAQVHVLELEAQMSGGSEVARLAKHLTTGPWDKLDLRQKQHAMKQAEWMIESYRAVFPQTPASTSA